MNQGEWPDDQVNDQARELAALAARSALGENTRRDVEVAIEAYVRKLIVNIREVRSATSQDLVEIDSIFVPPTFRYHQSTVERQLKDWLAAGGKEDEFRADDRRRSILLSSREVIDRLVGPAHFVLRGSPGQGKSIFLKYACRALIAEMRIPVFVELKKLNGRPITLRSLIEETLAFPMDEQGDVPLARLAHDSRSFVFLLDGLDEVVESGQRADIADEITRTFTGLLFGAPVVVSTRTERSNLISGYETLFLEPMDLELASKVAANVSGGDETFVDRFREAHYPALPEIFSIPLFIHILYASRMAQEPAWGVGEFLRRAVNHLAYGHDEGKNFWDRKAYAEFKRPAHLYLMSNLCLSLFQKGNGPLLRIDFIREVDRAKVAANDQMEAFGLADRIATDPEAIFETIWGNTGLLRFREGGYEFREQIFLDYYVAEHISSEVDRASLEWKLSTVGLIRNSPWIYRILASFDPVALSLKLINPVCRKLLTRLSEQPDLRSRLLYMVSSLVLDGARQRAYLRADGEKDSEIVVWSLLTNRAERDNITFLAVGAEYAPFLQMIKATGVEVDAAMGEEVILSLEALPHAAFGLPPFERACVVLLKALADLRTQPPIRRTVGLAPPMRI